MVPVADNPRHAEFRLPGDWADHATADSQVIVFLEQPDDDPEGDVKWGYPGEFDVEEATNDLIEGDDYFVRDASQGGVLEFEELYDGTYHVYMTDVETFGGYYPEFFTFTIDEEIEQYKAVNPADHPYRIHRNADYNLVSQISHTDINDAETLVYDDEGGFIDGLTGSYPQTVSFNDAGEFQREVRTTASAESGTLWLSYLGSAVQDAAVDDGVLTDYDVTIHVGGEEVETVQVVDDGDVVIEEDFEPEEGNIVYEEFASTEDPYSVDSDQQITMVHELDVDESAIEDRTTAYNLVDAVELRSPIGEDGLLELAFEVAAE
ncbi:hypothetical protein OB919_20745 [Halobacteria archaeon AArc-curdl1]|uniref:Uncharacterized protein n=1 Tax=Natronosalvus hydrolyticus TaxID=2979988 RepID=A0AAP2ZE92_9EURY|nr:hypothetical protein [Halobacteria archaeon AArc-curdl1]